MVYFSDSFGSNVRLDYGTGHEQNFMQIFYLLLRLGLVCADDFAELGLKVFFKYIRLMRKIQTVYWLEPAGSQGVWGLDDHHFMPFLLGASQLIGHAEVKLPRDILNRDLLEKYSQDYIYLSNRESPGCILHIMNIKSGGRFHETSPVLFDISGATSWTKVAGVVSADSGHGQDVPGRGAGQVPHHAALPLRQPACL